MARAFGSRKKRRNTSACVPGVAVDIHRPARPPPPDYNVAPLCYTTPLPARRESGNTTPRCQGRGFNIVIGGRGVGGRHKHNTTYPLGCRTRMVYSPYRTGPVLGHSLSPMRIYMQSMHGHVRSGGGRHKHNMTYPIGCRRRVVYSPYRAGQVLGHRLSPMRIYMQSMRGHVWPGGREGGRSPQT